MIFAEEELGELFGLLGGVSTMDDLCNEVAEALLAVASGWILVVLGENFVEFFWGDEGEVFEVFFERVVQNW